MGELGLPQAPRRWGWVEGFRRGVPVVGEAHPGTGQSNVSVGHPERTEEP